MSSPVVTFDFAYWTAGYSVFANLTQAQGQFYFDQAGLYCANTAQNPAYAIGADYLKQLLYMVTSHIAWLNAPRDANGNPAATGSPPSTLVGRIGSATEGSVSVSAEWKGSGSPSMEWWLQTQYGAAYWQATAQWRNFRYAARPTTAALCAPFPLYPSRFNN